jgi:hypothetical protein
MLSTTTKQERLGQHVSGLGFRETKSSQPHPVAERDDQYICMYIYVTYLELVSSLQLDDF